ncbi:MAG: hypothetical protein JNL70_14640 [Saprospiraceae bacterium]|nr:hypothetical protein [Saprospiraceae bacterium]
MATKKYNSPKISWAKERQSKLKSINENYDFGRDYNTQTGASLIDELQKEQDKYNDMKSLLDAQKLVVKEKEKSVNSFFVNILKRVSTEHGEDSTEYEKAGGKRTSNRKAPIRKVTGEKKTKVSS